MKSVVCRRRRRAKEVAGLILLADWHVTCLSNNTINKLCTDTGVQVTLLLTSTLTITPLIFEILCLGILLNLRTHSAC